MKIETGVHILYNNQITEAEKRGYKTFIIRDNGFTAETIVYKNKTSFNYLYQKYVSNFRYKLKIK